MPWVNFSIPAFAMSRTALNSDEPRAPVTSLSVTVLRFLTVVASFAAELSSSCTAGIFNVAKSSCIFLNVSFISLPIVFCVDTKAPEIASTIAPVISTNWNFVTAPKVPVIIFPT